ncbi:autotransporter assembly complex protein TamA [Acidithiobacillus caldus]|jgi:translocation and assembly module TamA|nr:BamA/TamA family outer membrane protein [Acidithiobacillus caldus]ACI62968.1 outer membrane protein [Acidithiobacillus caldus]AIA54933.1 Outer membrane protein [Acidithiobacillus caldus ATCC 51756]AUW32616.1 BamA/TamA family outer membrane protein [Acidithiobacillus caldus]MBU2728636.1 BamA/TamA family outer membrane protein [Acidithiobacillus caldus]MBU2734514.1 BamA/TamA family outer membrane protein [Acidithiobacillus caldus ATCC 51756]
MATRKHDSLGRARLGLLLLLLGFSATASADDRLHFRVIGVDAHLRELLNKALPAIPYDGKGARREELLLSEDLRLKSALEAYGYYAATWTRREIALEGDSYEVVYDVHAGRPIVLRDIDLRLQGPAAEDPAFKKRWNEFPLKRGAVLDQVLYEEWKDKSLELLHARGYVQAQYQRHEILMDRDAYWADIYLWLNSGERFKVGDIRIEGADRYPRWFITRYLSIAPGDWYSPEALAVSQSNLRNADRFSAVSVTGLTKEAANGKVPIAVRLKSLPAQHFKVGVGYSTDIGVNGVLGYDNYDMFDAAQHLKIDATVAQKTRNIGFAYTWPVGKTLGSEYLANAAFQNEVLNVYTNNALTANIGRQWTIGHGANPNRTETVRILMNLEQANYTVASQSNNSHYIYPSINFALSDYDNILRPISGYSLTATVEGSSKVLGSTTNFLRFSARGRWDTRLAPLWAAGLRARIGALQVSGPIGDLPPNLRFFAGGQDSLPGYAYLSQGPRAGNGQVEGGRYLAVVGANLQRFITKDIAIIAFYDAGNAFDSPADFRVLQDVGLGVRWFSPVGPIRLELAHPLVNPKAPAVRIAFSVGFGL